MKRWDLTSSGICEYEIKNRIAMSKKTFAHMENVLRNKKLTESENKIEGLNDSLWSGLMYGCETWTGSKSMKKRPDAAGMWLSSRVFEILWKERVTYKEVLTMADTKRELYTAIVRKQLLFFGRACHERKDLQREIMTGSVSGKGTKGRQRQKMYLDSALQRIKRYEVECDAELVSGLGELCGERLRGHGKKEEDNC